MNKKEAALGFRPLAYLLPLISQASCLFLFALREIGGDLN